MAGDPQLSRRGTLRAGLAVVGHPSLWPTALREVRALAPTGWWRRPPFLPLPDAEYLQFRLLTAYGSGAAGPDPHDVVTWLRWCRDWNFRERNRPLAGSHDG